MTKKRRRAHRRRNYGRGPAARKLQEFLEKHDIPDGAAAKLMKVSRPTVTFWTTARSFPGPESRKLIEKFTGGEVPAGMWDERA